MPVRADRTTSPQPVNAPDAGEQQSQTASSTRPAIVSPLPPTKNADALANRIDYDARRAR